MSSAFSYAVRGALTIAEVTAQAAEFQDLLSRNTALVLRTADLTRCDLSGLQLLVATLHQARLLKIDLHIESPPGSVLHAMLDQHGLLAGPQPTAVLTDDHWVGLSSPQ
ncbi:STAS domain-containing protein [Phaeovulum sp. W22_SRMD_FR3]|uniref:STAS domain-containing protein n=1 Tax=Phaeovulum sp. W22_SRMD_FR3 TaxID=3240274 RepID=UPI003F98A0BA